MSTDLSCTLHEKSSKQFNSGSGGHVCDKHDCHSFMGLHLLVALPVRLSPPLIENEVLGVSIAHHLKKP